MNREREDHYFANVTLLGMYLPQMCSFAEWSLKALCSVIRLSVGDPLLAPGVTLSSYAWPGGAGPPPCNYSVSLLLFLTGSCAAFRKAKVIMVFWWSGGVILGQRWVSWEVLKSPTACSHYGGHSVLRIWLMGFPLLVLEVSFPVLPPFTLWHCSEISVNILLSLLSVAFCNKKISLCMVQMILGSWLFALFCSGCYGLSLPFSEDGTKMVVLLPSCLGKLCCTAVCLFLCCAWHCVTEPRMIHVQEWQRSVTAESCSLHSVWVVRCSQDYGVIAGFMWWCSFYKTASNCGASYSQIAFLGMLRQ